MENCTELKLAHVYGIICLLCWIGYVINISIMFNKRLLNKTRYLLLFYLSIADSAFVSILSIVYATLTVFPSGYICDKVHQGTQYLTQVCFHSSCFLSVGFTLNQYLAVACGLRYHSIVTIKKIKTFVLTSVVIAAILNAALMADTEKIIVLQSELLQVRCVINGIILMSSSLIMLLNLVYANFISQRHMQSLSRQQRDSPYWKSRKRVRIEVTIITSVVIVALAAMSLFYIKIHIIENTFDAVWLSVTRAIGLLFCAINPYLYMFTLHEIRKTVLKFFKCSCSCYGAETNHSSSTIPDYSKSSIFSSQCARGKQKIHNELRLSDILHNGLSIGIYTIASDEY